MEYKTNPKGGYAYFPSKTYPEDFELFQIDLAGTDIDKDLKRKVNSYNKEAKKALNKLNKARQDVFNRNANDRQGVEVETGKTPQSGHFDSIEGLPNPGLLAQGKQLKELLKDHSVVYDYIYESKNDPYFGKVYDTRTGEATDMTYEDYIKLIRDDKPRPARPATTATTTATSTMLDDMPYSEARKLFKTVEETVNAINTSTKYQVGNKTIEALEKEGYDYVNGKFVKKATGNVDENINKTQDSIKSAANRINRDNRILTPWKAALELSTKDDKTDKVLTGLLLLDHFLSGVSAFKNKDSKPSMISDHISTAYERFKKNVSTAQESSLKASTDSLVSLLGAETDGAKRLIELQNQIANTPYETVLNTLTAQQRMAVLLALASSDADVGQIVKGGALNRLLEPGEKGWQNILIDTGMYTAGGNIGSTIQGFINKLKEKPLPRK